MPLPHPHLQRPPLRSPCLQHSHETRCIARTALAYLSQLDAGAHLGRSPFQQYKLRLLTHGAVTECEGEFGIPALSLLTIPLSYNPPGEPHVQASLQSRYTPYVCILEMHRPSRGADIVHWHLRSQVNDVLPGVHSSASSRSSSSSSPSLTTFGGFQRSLTFCHQSLCRELASTNVLLSLPYRVYRKTCALHCRSAAGLPRALFYGCSHFPRPGEATEALRPGPSDGITDTHICHTRSASQHLVLASVRLCDLTDEAEAEAAQTLQRCSGKHGNGSCGYFGIGVGNARTSIRYGMPELRVPVI